jgi:hypothetical protein
MPLESANRALFGLEWSDGICLILFPTHVLIGVCRYIQEKHCYVGCWPVQYAWPIGNYQVRNCRNHLFCPTNDWLKAVLLGLPGMPQKTVSIEHRWLCRGRRKRDRPQNWDLCISASWSARICTLALGSSHGIWQAWLSGLQPSFDGLLNGITERQLLQGGGGFHLCPEVFVHLHPFGLPCYCNFLGILAHD